MVFHLLTPSELAFRFHSLPPRLHITTPGPMPSYSKAPRGLFVLLRVARIFTGPSISSSLWLRQRSSRYAFPAGRNLPDKGFRYLRTVIVTAAVHRGFSLKLCFDCSKRTSLLNLPALGRRQPLYIAFRLKQGPMFLLNSRQSLCSESPSRSPRNEVHHLGHPFSQSYGVNLPRSLPTVLSSALVRLHQPTSVGLRYGHPSP